MYSDIAQIPNPGERTIGGTLIDGVFLLGPPKSAGGSGGRILETRGFGDFERFLFDRETLAFVAMPRPTPLQDDGASVEAGLAACRCGNPIGHWAEYALLNESC